MADNSKNETDKLLRAIHQHLLDIKVEIVRINSHLARQDEAISRLHSCLFEWCGPDHLKRSIAELDYQEIDAPTDLDELLSKFKP